MVQVPTAYQPGYEAALKIDRELTETYAKNIYIADPLADAAVASMAHLRPDEVHELLNGCMNGDPDTLKSAPQEVKIFFESISEHPPWYDQDVVSLGGRAFFQNADMIIISFCASAIIKGFTTLIAKSFVTTGRVTDYAIRRLRQNILQLVEVCIPSGLEPHGDGWKLTTRIRLVHAQVRSHLYDPVADWDFEGDGPPLHAAHMAIGAAFFSYDVVKGASRLGMKMTQDEKEAYIHIWRYVGLLLGVPEDILFKNWAEAGKLVEVAPVIEPTPEIDSIIIANALLNAAPLAAGISDPEEIEWIRHKVYQASRSFIGDEVADALHFPKYSTFGVLGYLKWRRRYDNLMLRINSRTRRSENFASLLAASLLDDEAISYRLPDNVFSSHSSQW